MVVSYLDMVNYYLDYETSEESKFVRNMTAFPLDKITIENESYRRVICTTDYQQLVLMSLKPGEEITNHNHDYSDQSMVLVQGSLYIILTDKSGIQQKKTLNKGDALFIPQEVYHNIFNLESISAKFYLNYSPPIFKPDLIIESKPKNGAS
jgi:quercetin dioxygenase-like cupin family protein